MAARLGASVQALDPCQPVAFIRAESVASPRAAAEGGRGVAGLLFGVTPTDPATFLAVAAVLFAAAARYVPVLRATRIRPVVAPRTE